MYFPTLWSTQPPMQWLPGTISPGVKRPGHEADQGQHYVDLYTHGAVWWSGTLISNNRLSDVSNISKDWQEA
jgi:hypothetical protein